MTVQPPHSISTAWAARRPYTVDYRPGIDPWASEYKRQFTWKATLPPPPPLPVNPYLSSPRANTLPASTSPRVVPEPTLETRSSYATMNSRPDRFANSTFNTAPPPPPPPPPRPTTNVTTSNVQNHETYAFPHLRPYTAPVPVVRRSRTKGVGWADHIRPAGLPSGSTHYPHQPPPQDHEPFSSQPRVAENGWTGEPVYTRTTVDTYPYARDGVYASQDSFDPITGRYGTTNSDVYYTAPGTNTRKYVPARSSTTFADFATGGAYTAPIPVTTTNVNEGVPPNASSGNVHVSGNAPPPPPPPPPPVTNTVPTTTWTTSAATLAPPRAPLPPGTTTKLGHDAPRVIPTPADPAAGVPSTYVPPSRSDLSVPSSLNRPPLRQSTLASSASDERSLDALRNYLAQRKVNRSGWTSEYEREFVNWVDVLKRLKAPTTGVA
ncbi:hypothetical protein DFS34DRAFT_146550 [Phlyctochytrium arcticum]|nr:hypothetical protein DFS34DRAFT_146550 [Phlyctochytrium arcticum]